MPIRSRLRPSFRREPRLPGHLAMVGLVLVSTLSAISIGAGPLGTRPDDTGEPGGPMAQGLGGGPLGDPATASASATPLPTPYPLTGSRDLSAGIRGSARGVCLQLRADEPREFATAGPGALGGRRSAATSSQAPTGSDGEARDGTARGDRDQGTAASSPAGSGGTAAGPGPASTPSAPSAPGTPTGPVVVPSPPSAPGTSPAPSPAPIPALPTPPPLPAVTPPPTPKPSPKPTPTPVIVLPSLPLPTPSLDPGDLLP